MTRLKRSLEETDPNVHGAPAPKRASTGKAKENDAPSTTQKMKKTTARTSKQLTPSSKDPTSTSNKAQSREDEKSWVYICNPKEATCQDKDACVCGKPADENTSYRWAVTRKGYELAAEWRVQKRKRDQDNFGMYIFNDWTGYGICEVIENMFLAFNKEEKKKNRDPLEMWSHIEGMALFLNDDIAEWHMFHDSEGNAKRTMLVGTGLLKTLEILSEADLFKDDRSDIRNAGLIVAHLLTFAHGMNPRCRLNENGWQSKVLQKADECNITIEGIPGIEKIVAEIRETEHSQYSNKDQNVVDSFTECMLCYKSRSRSGGVLTLESLKARVVRGWKHWAWSLEFEAYSQYQSVKVGPGCAPVYGGRIGGKFYDLTAQRNKGGHMKQYCLSKGAW